MATTDQLRKASQRTGLQLNDFPRDRYIQELEDAGHAGIRGLTKLELFKRVRKAGIEIVPAWHARRNEE